MKTLELADVPEDRVLSLRLPDDVAAGPMEVPLSRLTIDTHDKISRRHV